MEDKGIAQKDDTKRTAKVGVALSPPDNVINSDELKTVAKKGGVWPIDIYLALAAREKPESRSVSERIVFPHPELIEPFQLLGPAARVGTGANAKDMGTKQ